MGNPSWNVEIGDIRLPRTTLDEIFQYINAADKPCIIAIDEFQTISHYPGGKVEYTAYDPLMRELASEGMLCALLEMPFNLAILDTGAADGIADLYPEVENWYIGGHSLGGSAASMYLEDNYEIFDGLVLLGSYSTSDLSNCGIEVLSVFGSEDKVMNHDNYNENIANLPVGFKEVIIEGGCHAYFGMYGHQDGDGTPSITNEEQIKITAKEIIEFMK